MKLSDVDPKDIELVSHPDQQTPLKLSSVSPSDISQPEVPSTASDMLSGAEKGLGGDIVAGGVQSGLDTLQSLAHNLGLASASPTQVSAALQKMGVQGNIGPTSEKQMYRQSADAQNKEFAEAQGRSPTAFSAGELGGMGLGIMGGEGALKGMGIGTKLMQAPEGAGLFTRIATHAVNAAPAGAVIGAMQSKGNLIDAAPQEQLQMAKDAGVGGLTGSLVGAGVSLLGEGVSAGAKLAGKTAAGQRIAGMFNLGREGADLSSPTAMTGSLDNPETLNNSIALHDQRAAQAVVGGIQEANTLLGKQMDEAVNNATQEGIVMKAGPEMTEKIDQLFQHEAIAPEAEAGIAQEKGTPAELSSESDTGEAAAIDEAKGETNAPAEEAADTEQVEGQEEGPEFQNKSLSKFFDYAKKMKDEGLNPVEARDFTQKLYKMGRQLQIKDPGAANDIYELAGDLNQMLKRSVPKYAQAAERFDQFNRATSETILSKNIPIETTNIRLSRTRNANTQVLKNTMSIIKGLNNPNDRVAQGTFANLLRGLQDFNNQELMRKAEQATTNPNFQTIFEQLGMSPQDIESFMRDKAYRSHLIQTYSGAPSMPMGAGGDIMKGIQAVGKGADYLVNKAGKIYGKSHGPSENAILNTSKKLYAASDDALRSLGQRLQDLPGQKPISEALMKAIENKDAIAKNAILFSIMQNPNLRNVADSDNLIVGE